MKKKYKPYPKYKDSGVAWLGEVPEGWELERAKNLFSLAKRDVLADDEIVTAFRDGEVTLRRNRRLDGFTTSIKEIGYQRVCKGDLVIHAMDAFAGAIGVADSDGKCSPVYSCCIPNEDINSVYYGMLLRTMALSGFIESLAKGVRERSTEFRWKDFAIQVLPTPSYLEQLGIQYFLNQECGKIDALIAEQEKLVALLREKRQAVISHVVTKGLNPNTPMKDSGVEWLGEVPKHWEIVRLSRHAWIRARLGWKGLKAEEYVEDGYIFLATPNIKDKELDFDNVNYITKERYDESPEIKLSIGDVLLVKDGSTLGITNIVKYLPKDATVNSSIAVITTFKSLFPNFLMYILKSIFIISTIEKLKGGMGVPHLFQSDINVFIIPFPPLSEQHIIAKHLEQQTSKIDALINEANKAVDLLKERRSALISAAVTGKIDIYCFTGNSYVT